MATIATLDHISKIYANGTVALAGIDLSIRQGEFVSLVGPSGCGKSTVLRLLAGLGQPTQGTIHWHLPATARQLAFVFQDAALMPWATVIDNVHLPLKLQGRSLRSSRGAIAAALAMVDLHGVDYSYPRQLSGGMKMRVSIARSLVTQPNVLLMDEPFGALDEMTRGKLNSDLLHLWEQKHWTVVFVTHNIYEAVFLSSRVVVMAAQPGQIIAEVPIQTAYPRDEAFRVSPQFGDYCRQILAHLTAAAAAPDRP